MITDVRSASETLAASVDAVQVSEEVAKFLELEAVLQGVFDVPTGFTKEAAVALQQDILAEE